MSNVRKVLRFGRPFGIFKGIIERFNDKEEKMMFTRTIADLCLIVFFLLDHPTYLQRVLRHYLMKQIGMVKMGKPTVEKLEFYSNFYWLLECFFSLASELVALFHSQQKIVSSV
jgi:hypothetical protein